VRGRRIVELSSQEATLIGVIVSFDYDGGFDRERVLGIAEKARIEFVEVAALVDSVPAAVA